MEPTQVQNLLRVGDIIGPTNGSPIHFIEGVKILFTKIFTQNEKVYAEAIGDRVTEIGLVHVKKPTQPVSVTARIRITKVHAYAAEGKIVEKPDNL